MNDLSTHGVVVLIQDKNGRYLLLKDTRKDTKDWWAPPHGLCEPIDKTEKESVAREVFEKSGLKVRPIKKIHTQPADTKADTVSFWDAELIGGDIVLDYKSSAYGWFTVKEALELQLYPGTKTFFETMLR